VVGNKDKYECIKKLETPHPIKYNNILDQPRVCFIESWFQRILGEAMQSYPQHIGFIFSPIRVESSPDSFVQVSICFTTLEFITKTNWMLEWLHWKYTYT
jgi:hypothetical protein